MFRIKVQDHEADISEGRVRAAIKQEFAARLTGANLEAVVDKTIADLRNKGTRFGTAGGRVFWFVPDTTMQPESSMERLARDLADVSYHPAHTTDGINSRLTIRDLADFYVKRDPAPPSAEDCERFLRAAGQVC